MKLSKRLVVVLFAVMMVLPTSAFAAGSIAPMAVSAVTANISKSGTTITGSGTASFGRKEATASLAIELQQYKNGAWVYYSKMSPNKTGTNCISLTASKSFSVEKGYRYRIKVTATSTNTKTAYSAAVTV